MRPSAQDQNIFAGLRDLLHLVGAKPSSWVIMTTAASIVLALLDTLGVAAMVPLTQLISGTTPQDGALGVIADVVGSDDPAVLIPVVALAISALFIVKSLGSLWFRWWVLGRTTQVSALAGVELMRLYALAPYADHRQRKTSETYRNVLTGTNQASSVLLSVVTLATDVLVLAAITTVLAITAPLVTLGTVVLFGSLVFGLQSALRRRQTYLGEEFAQSSMQEWQFLTPALDGFREARLTSSASGFVDGFRRARLRGAHAAQQLGIMSDVPRYLLEVGFVIAIAGMAVVLFITTSPSFTLTILGLFAAASLRALPTLTRVSANFGTIRIGQVGLNIVSTVSRDLRRRGIHEERPQTDIRYAGDIVVRDVSFQYADSETPLLTDVTLTIEENRTTAFVGSSGAGKSTLLDLVLGLLSPTAGAIECGGRNIGDDPAAWFSELGVVPQDVFLLNDTVSANIAFGIDEGDRDPGRISEVVEKARLSSLLAELPDGLDTMIGERGMRLSGGQRQRLGLARALYRRPRVLVLDEATSALDNLTEHEITRTLAGLNGSMTVILVAHRLSTVRGADRLVFLSRGRVEAQGTFEEVRRASPDFAHLVELGDLR